MGKAVTGLESNPVTAHEISNNIADDIIVAFPNVEIHISAGITITYDDGYDLCVDVDYAEGEKNVNSYRSYYEGREEDEDWDEEDEEEDEDGSVIETIWNCYCPYIKGKKEDIERLLSQEAISDKSISNKTISGDIISFKLVEKNTYSSRVDSKLVMDIIKKYPELIVACIITGDPSPEVYVEVVISEYGYPCFTKGKIIGNDASDDPWIMEGFEDLFKDYNEKGLWEEPHSGIEMELYVDYSFPFFKEWDNSNLMDK